jgi:hypothetical protein
MERRCMSVAAFYDPSKLEKLAPHQLAVLFAELLIGLLRKQGVPDIELPQCPEPISPPVVEEPSNDFGAFKLFLDANPAIREAIRAGEL